MINWIFWISETKLKKKAHQFKKKLNGSVIFKRYVHLMLFIAAALQHFFLLQRYSHFHMGLCVERVIKGCETIAIIFVVVWPASHPFRACNTGLWKLIRVNPLCDFSFSHMYGSNFFLLILPVLFSNFTSFTIICFEDIITVSIMKYVCTFSVSFIVSLSFIENNTCLIE